MFGLEINESFIKAAYRYSGGRGEPSEKEKAEIVSLAQNAVKQLNPRGTKDYFLVEKTENGVKLIGTNAEFCGELIKKHLKNSFAVCAFSVTLGFESETVLLSAAGNSYKKLLTDGVLSAIIEEFADYFEEEITRDFPFGDAAPAPRFSCGYGDFALSSQKTFYRLLSLNKTLGITLNETSFMIFPNKTVTAIIGFEK
ncbi:MAG: hypothetical protein LBN25_01405 [Christensenellaceae bacterium]|jgi:hypothetical protein|nr:hypothetical protein [Christensenellaceae bacterium]